MIILGLNAFHADSSAAILRDGKLIAAAEEERFCRIKHWAGFPNAAIKYCLNEAGLKLSDVDHVAFNQRNSANALRKIVYLLSQRPSFSLVSSRIRNRRARLNIPTLLERVFPDERTRAKFHAVEHHLAHLSSAFHVSPFEEAAVVSVDGFGDFSSAAWGTAAGSEISILGRVYFPHSLGVFYQAITQYLGFPYYGDEYKVMGLAPYGRPSFADLMRKMVELLPQGGFRLDLNYFRHHRENISFQWNDTSPDYGDLFSPELEKLLGPRRLPTDPLDDRHRNIARSAQAIYEEAFFHLIRALHKRTGLTDLALAGGCAMNSVANGKEVACLLADHRSELSAANCNLEEFSNEALLCRRTAEMIANGGVVGWFQGRMEWGPRALGNRSILCDPRRADMKSLLNDKIKRRESFRPLAPSVLEESVAEWFEEDDAVPFMMQVFQIRVDKRHLIPAVTHVDGSGRLQTVGRRTNSRYHCLIESFQALTGIPMVLNTSFNENEPVVCTPKEALDCFLRTKMDALVISDILISRLNPS